MAPDLSPTAEMGENEPGVEPGDPILSAVGEAFEPRPPSYRPVEREAADPGSDPVPIPRRRAGDTPLFGPNPAERRARLNGLIARGIASIEVADVARLLTSDPDPTVRLLAARGLAAGRHRLSPSVLAAALTDPQDNVRREVVALFATDRREALRLLLPLATDRRWPMTQLAVLQSLPARLAQVKPLDPEMGALLAGVASLDPPPLPGERQSMAAVARSIGPDTLTRWLAARDIRRLGAARLLALTGAPAAEHALAALGGDPSVEVRHLAVLANQALRARGEGAGEVPAPGVRAGSFAETEEATKGTAEVSPGEPVLIASLARAMADPERPVRAQAQAALDRVPHALVTDWAIRSLEAGAGETAELAARVAGKLRLTAAAPGLLRRASAVHAEARGPYLKALQSLGVEPAELAALVAGVEPGHRQEAVRLVWQVAGRAVLPHLSPLLADSAGPVRMAVIEVLAESGDPAGTSIARERLATDSSAAVRATAIHALAASEPSTRLEALARALSDPDPDVRATAVEALPNGVDGMVDLLAPAFADKDERVWRATLSHLAALPERDLPAVWRVVRQAPPDKREELVRAIEAIDTERLMRLAATNARGSSPEDRALAVELAARAGSVEAARLVMTALEDPDPSVRRTAASAMTTLRAPAAVPALSRSLTDPQAEVRIEAIRALGLIDDDTVPSVLIGALRDPEVRVREMAADSLSRWHSPAVAQRLAAALTSPDLRRAAGEVLARMGPMAVEALAEVATGENPDAATAAGVLLERIAGAGPFIDRMSSIEPEERLRAVRVLGALGGPAASEALIPALSDPDVRVRSQAATALGALGFFPALKQLRRMFLTDPVAEAAAAAEGALRRLGAVPGEENQAGPEGHARGESENGPKTD